jgi:hypothetical protein
VGLAEREVLADKGELVVQVGHLMTVTPAAEEMVDKEETEAQADKEETANQENRRHCTKLLEAFLPIQPEQVLFLEILRLFQLKIPDAQIRKFFLQEVQTELGILVPVHRRQLRRVQDHIASFIVLWVESQLFLTE